MKSNISSKVAVSLFIASASCATAVSIANAAGRLKDFGWAITPLFFLSGVSLLVAIVLLLRSGESKNEDAMQRVCLAFARQPDRHVTDLMLETRLSEKQLRKHLDKLIADGKISYRKDQYGIDVWHKAIPPRR